MDIIKEIYLECSKLWWKADRKFSLDMKKYSTVDKKIKENKMDKYIDLIIQNIKEFPKEDNKKESWKNDFDNIIDNFIESEEESFKLGMVNKNLKDDFFKSTKMFIKEAKEFDKNLSYSDIGQAMRNVWIINLLQAAFGEKVEDKISNKLINFTITALNNNSCFKGENINELKELIKTNCIMLILFSAILSKEFFSSNYINVIEEYLPFSIKYIENIKFKLRKKVKKVEFEDALNFILDIN